MFIVFIDLQHLADKADDIPIKFGTKKTKYFQILKKKTPKKNLSTVQPVKFPPIFTTWA